MGVMERQGIHAHKDNKHETHIITKRDPNLYKGQGNEVHKNAEKERD